MNCVAALVESLEKRQLLSAVSPSEDTTSVEIVPEQRAGSPEKLRLFTFDDIRPEYEPDLLPIFPPYIDLLPIFPLYESFIVPGAVEITGPVGMTESTQVTLRWRQIQNASDYEIQLYDVEAGKLVYELRSDLREVTPHGTAYGPAVPHRGGMVENTVTLEDSPLQHGRQYQFFVRALNNQIAGPWSHPHEFQVADDPDQIELAPGFFLPKEIYTERANTETDRPIITGTVQTESGDFSDGSSSRIVVVYGGTTNDATPNASWEAAEDAHHYEVEVYDRVAGRMVQQHGRIENSIELLPLGTGENQVFVREIDGTGQAGKWSSPSEFRVDLNAFTAPEIVAPGAYSTDNSVTIRWKDDGAKRYELYFFNTRIPPQTNEINSYLVLHEDQIVSTSFTVSGIQWSDYQVFVRGFDSDGNPTSWATHEFEFTNQFYPLWPTLTGPTQPSTDGRVLIQWTPSRFVQDYEVLLYDLNAGRLVLHESVRSSSQFEPDRHLPPGRYQVFVSSVSPTGSRGSWGSRLEFDVLEAD